MVRLPFPRPQRTKYSSAQLPCTLRPSRQCSPSQVTKSENGSEIQNENSQTPTSYQNQLSLARSKTNRVQSLLQPALKPEMTYMANTYQPPLRARAATVTAVSTWGTNVVRTTGVATSLIATAEEPPVHLPFSNPTRLSVMRSLSASR